MLDEIKYSKSYLTNLKYNANFVQTRRSKNYNYQP